MIRANQTIKDEFLAVISHELRTPISGILGMSEVLISEVYGALNAEQIEALKSIEESGHHLLALINNILDISRFSVGKLKLDIIQVPIKQVCESCLRSIERDAKKKHLHISSSYDSAITVVQADERRLKQILLNLLNNAVKFNFDGGTVGLETVSEPETKLVKFTVWDTGIGIPKEKIPMLFQPFVQLDGGLSLSSGIGLGLVLTYHLLEAHNSSISVESELGKGSKFTFSLPWVPDSDILDEVNPNKTMPLRADETKAMIIMSEKERLPLVLLTDDNELSIKSISAYLLANGFAVSVARNGGDAIIKTHENKPDIILMDIQMPETDGLEAIRRIRADNDFINIPIIALTALAMPEDREKCLEAGADEYISKPVNLNNLVMIIEEQLRLKSSKDKGIKI